MSTCQLFWRENQGPGTIPISMPMAVTMETGRRVAMSDIFVRSGSPPRFKSVRNWGGVSVLGRGLTGILPMEG